MTLKLLIHCGSHKTASTSLQEKILPLSSSYQYIGKSEKSLSKDLGSYLGIQLTRFCIQTSRLRTSQVSELANLKNNILYTISTINKESQHKNYLYSNESILQNYTLWHQEKFNKDDPPLIPIVELEKLSIIANYSSVFGFRRNIIDYTVSLYLEIQKKRNNLGLPYLSIVDWISFQLELFQSTNLSCFQLYTDFDIPCRDKNYFKNMIQLAPFENLKESPFQALTELQLPESFIPLRFSKSKEAIKKLFEDSRLNTTNEKSILPYILKINSVREISELKEVAKSMLKALFLDK